MGTADNLQAAFAEESKAHMKYMAYAAAAEKEGLKQVAKLFRALAESERVHAQSHLMVMGEVGSTDDNLSSAADGETYEFTQMYPSFIQQADKDGNQRAVASFRNAMKAEKVHANLLAAQMDNSSKENDYHVCQICGQTIAGGAPDKCGVCGAPGAKFRQID